MMGHMRGKRLSDFWESGDNLEDGPNCHNRYSFDEMKECYSPPYIKLTVNRDRKNTPGNQKGFRVTRGGSDRHVANNINSKLKSKSPTIRKLGDPADRTRKNMSVSKRAQKLLCLVGKERTFGKFHNKYFSELLEKETPSSQG